MIRSSLRLGRYAALAVSFAAVMPAATLLTFSGLRDGEQVLNFYNGGTGSLGSFFFNYGVAFAPGAVALVDSDVGGTGNFANAPSPFTVLFSTTGTLSFNVSSGFVEALTFFYATYGNGAPGSVSILSGLNGSGTQLGSATLNALNQICPGDPQGGFYGCWQSVTIPFSGTARSAVFTLPILVFGVDSIGLTLPLIENANATAIPEPASFALSGGALLGVWMLRKAWRARLN